LGVGYRSLAYGLLVGLGGVLVSKRTLSAFYFPR
jgi:hypothetical protein